MRAYRMRVFPIIEDDDEVEWGVEFPDLPGCVGGGDTVEEAIAMAKDAQKAWIGAALDSGEMLPTPTTPETSDYSGKFTLRLPKTLHRSLALRAEDEGVSINQLILYLISCGINEETASSREIHVPAENTDESCVVMWLWRSFERSSHISQRIIDSVQSGRRQQLWEKPQV